MPTERSNHPIAISLFLQGALLLSGCSKATPFAPSVATASASPPRATPVRATPSLIATSPPTATATACPPREPPDFPSWALPTPSHPPQTPYGIYGLIGSIYEVDPPFGEHESGRILDPEAGPITDPSATLFAVDYLTTPNERLLLFTREFCNLTYQVLDVLDISHLPNTQAIFYAGCSRAGKEDPELVAIVLARPTIREAWPNVNPLGGSSHAVMAWLASRKFGRFVPVDPEGIRCLNAGEGYSYPWELP